MLPVAGQAGDMRAMKTMIGYSPARRLDTVVPPRLAFIGIQPSFLANAAQPAYFAIRICVDKV
jgi:hypothetical protein